MKSIILIVKIIGDRLKPLDQHSQISLDGHLATIDVCYPKHKKWKGLVMASSVVVVKNKSPIAPQDLDAVTPFLRAVVSGSVCASWCAGVLMGLAWKLLRPIVFTLVTAGGFVFGIVLWAAAVVGVLAFVGWIARDK